MVVKRKRGGSLEDILVKQMTNIINRYQESIRKSKKSDVKGELYNASAILQYARQTQPQFRRKSQAQLSKAIDKALSEIRKNDEVIEINDTDSEFEMDESVQMMEVKDTNFFNRSIQNMYKNNNGNGNNDDLQSVDSTTTTESKTVTEKKEKEEKNKEFSIAEDTPSSSQRVPRQSSAPPDLKASTTSDNENVTSTALTRRIRKKSRTLIDNIETKKRKLTDNGSNNENKYAPPSVKLENVGGIEHILQDIIQLILMPFKHLEIHLHLGIKPPRGILLHGPPGCGKTLLANAIAGELNVPFLNISAPSIVSGMSGESEKKLREFFEEAKEQAPCLLFIDEIDAITPKRETAQREMERRIVAQLLTCLDDLSLEKTNNRPVMIIGATNRPDSLDPALRRAGRFDREISMGVPDEEGREKILKVLCKDLRLSDDLNFRALAKLTPGYVGADLSALTSEAGMIAVERIYGNLLNSVEEEEEENKENENESEQEQQDDSTMEKDEEEKEEEEREGEEGEEKDTEESMDIDEPVSETKKDETEKESETENKPLIKKDGIKPHEITLEILSKFIKSKSEPLTDEELKPLCITIEDFQKAVKKVQPSSKREGFATVPGVSWDDVGALETVREELNMAVVEPIRHPEYFAAVGITAPMGVLLYGPPGCGKTLLAKAVANESHSNFISVKGPELLNKYVGESERAIRQVFSRARASSPCVIFFDELDAICPKRSNDTDSTSSARLVNTLLTEMDGLDNRKQVFVIAATNRPELIDSAMVRPGRLDRMLYVDLPTAPERLDILKTITKKTPLDNTIDLEKIANDPRCEGFSGADLASLVREASVTALRTSIYKNETSIKKSTLSLSNALPDDDTKKIDSIYVCPSHFDVAFSKIVRSVSPKDYRSYKLMSKRLSGVRGKFISKSESIEDVSSAPKDTPTPSTEKPEDVSTTTTTPVN